MIILDHAQIEALIDLRTAAPAIEAAYVAASRGAVNLPAVRRTTFADLGADCHADRARVVAKRQPDGVATDYLWAAC